MDDTDQLFAVAMVWTLIAIFVAIFIRNWWARVAFVALAVGIPFWELPYGYYNFQKLCREEGKLQVFEKIPPQKTVCADYPYVTLHKELLKDGFASVEVRTKTGEVRIYAANQTVDAPIGTARNITSSYCMTFANNNRLPWRVLRHDVLIKHTSDNRLVARQSRFDWSGMWWQHATMPVLGHGGYCYDDPKRASFALLMGSG